MIRAALLLVLTGSCLGQLEDTDPPRICLCVTANNLHIRHTAGLEGEIIGTASKGECFEYTGKDLFEDGYKWLSVVYREKDAWAAGKYLERGNSSKCSEPVKSCDGRGGPFDERCLSCICQVESKCKPIGCHMDVGSLSCGYYQIKQPYYIDCYSPGSDWKTCADDLKCATSCVNNYINRYYSYCTGSSSPKCCEDAARIHNGGPKGCKRSATIGYWNLVQRCLGRS